MGVWDLYLFKDTVATERRESAEYWHNEILLWIAHSSSACYRKQLAIERAIPERASIDTVALAFKPLVKQAIAEYKAEFPRRQRLYFNVSLDDLCTELAREYQRGHRRDD